MSKLNICAYVMSLIGASDAFIFVLNEQTLIAKPARLMPIASFAFTR